MKTLTRNFSKLSRRNFSLLSPIRGIVSDIQKLCVHDGDGIRSVVYLKGCNMTCKWCHNVECIEPNILKLLDSDGNEEVIGKEFSVDEVMNVIEGEKPFYETSGGGVTISGGEPLFQRKFTHDLLKECKKAGLSTAIETNMSYCVMEDGLNEVVDVVIADIKLIDDTKHKEWTGVSNKTVLENIRRASENGVRLYIRTPIIPDVNDSPEDVEAIAKFVAGLPRKVWRYELLPFHPLAESKYEKLGIEYSFRGETFLDEENFSSLKDVVRAQGVDLFDVNDDSMSLESKVIEKGEISNERVKKLREISIEQSFNPSLSVERAEIVTDVYEEFEGKLSIPMLRAKVFYEIFDKKELYIGDDELIVGERGNKPHVVPTFPELTCHSEQDLEVLDTREKTFYRVDEEMKERYKERIIPFWRGKAIRDLVFEKLPSDYVNAYHAGLYTEFLEQRAPGHTVCGGKIYEMGFKDITSIIDEEIEKRKDVEGVEHEIEELKAMRVTSEGIINYGRRYSKYALELSKIEKNEKRRDELLEISKVCASVPENAPQTFYEALQMYLFCHIGVITELNPWDAFSPGRLCVHLEPFYHRDIRNGVLNRKRAKELLQSFFVKFNNFPAPPKVGVTAKESSTYMDFVNITVGGLLENGESAAGEVSRLLLEVISEMKLLQPSTNIQISEKTPNDFVQDALRIVRKGYGFPSLFNSDMIVEELVRAGKSLEDARMGGCSGCVEVGAFGHESNVLTGYFNLPKALELTLANGMDILTEKMIGKDVGDVCECNSYEEFFQMFDEQMNYLLDVKIKGNNCFEEQFAETMPVPFLSCLIDDCITNGVDYNRGGARYHTRYIQGTGIGTLSDSLSGIKYGVYEQKEFTMGELIDALRANFDGYEDIRYFLMNECPKYGNNHDFVDNLMTEAFGMFLDSVERRKSVYGGDYKVNMLSTTVHMHFGNFTAASPDGRLKHEPISDGISPVCGMELNSPTGVFLSCGKMDHGRTGGTLLNMRLSPQLLEKQLGLDTLTNLVRTYFRIGGHHVQFNVVTSETLKRAQENPEKFRDLMVRVAGYSDYFCNLSFELQEEVIRRTIHQEGGSI